MQIGLSNNQLDLVGNVRAIIWISLLQRAVPFSFPVETRLSKLLEEAADEYRSFSTSIIGLAVCESESIRNVCVTDSMRSLFSGDPEDDTAESFDMWLCLYGGLLRQGQKKAFAYDEPDAFRSATTEIALYAIEQIVQAILYERGADTEGDRTGVRAMLTQVFDKVCEILMPDPALTRLTFQSIVDRALLQGKM